MSKNKGITLMGLGPGDPKLLTRQAWEVLNQADEILLRTQQHPVVVSLPPKLVLHNFDGLYDKAESFEQLYAEIIDTVIDLGHRPQGIIYAVPGHPFVAEATGPEIFKRATEEGLPVRVIEGLSFLEPVITVLGLDPFPQTTLIDALELAVSHYPSFPPDAPALIAQIYSRETASETKLTLMSVYPDEHQVSLIHAAGTEMQIIENVSLYEIDRSEHLGFLSCLYLPPLETGTSVESFAEVVAHLRAPDGCPWDQKQSLVTLRPHLLEEAYEVVSAIDNGDVDELKEELGDLLLMILMLSQIASEEDEFRFVDVVHSIYAKIVRRHPHVFGEMKLEDEEDVLANWEKLKEEERQKNGQENKGLLNGVSAAMPALQQAQEIQDRAARVGFDWHDANEVWEKVVEELHELRTAHTINERSSEFGDLLFTLVNLSRHLDIEAEGALRSTNTRFRNRFGYIEKIAKERNISLHDITLQQMDELWERAKKIENEDQK